MFGQIARLLFGVAEGADILGRADQRDGLPGLVADRPGESQDAEELTVAPGDEPVAAHHLPVGHRHQVLMVGPELVVRRQHVENRPPEDLVVGPAIQLFGRSVPEQDVAVRIGDDDGPHQRVEHRPRIDAHDRWVVRVVGHPPPRMTEN